METAYTTEQSDDAFLQQLVMCEEDRLRHHPATQWAGGYRWFKSPNVIQLEIYRDREGMDLIRQRLLRR